MKQEIDLNCKLIDLKLDLILLYRIWFAFASTFHCLRVESAQRRPMARFLPGPLMTHVSTIAAAERRQV